MTKRFYLVAIAFFSFAMVLGQDDVRYLKGGNARGTGNIMAENGYRHVKTEKDNNSAFAYYWRQRDKKCVCLVTRDGRVRDVLGMEDKECKNTRLASSSTSKRYVDWHDLVGMAQINVEDALKKRGFEETHSYNYNNRLHKVFFRKASGQCIEAIIDREARNVINIHHNESCYEKGGQYEDKNYVDWHDLIGMAQINVEDALKKRGFREVHAYNYNNRRHKVYYRDANAQCIETIIDVQARNVIAIHHNDNCSKWK